MAWTVTKTKTVFGNEAVIHLHCVADAATQAIETGLKNITAFHTGFDSMATVVGLTIAANSGTTGTAIAGTLGCSGFTSGDDFFITVYGTR